MKTIQLFIAAFELGYNESLTIENDGKMWHGTDNKRIYLTVAQIKTITDKANKIEADKNKAKQAVLDRLGITVDEAALLLG